MSSANLPRQPLSVYSVMLILSALLMFVACILMAIELTRYGSPWESTGVPNASRSQSVFAAIDHHSLG